MVFKMKLGIGSYTFTWAVGVPGYQYNGQRLAIYDLFKKAAEYEAEIVQLCDNIPLHNYSTEELQALKLKADILGLSIEIGTRGIEAEHLKKYLEIAEIFQSPIVRVILHSEGGKLSVEDAVSGIRQVLPALEQKNIKLAIENHERHTVKELKKILSLLDHTHVGICLDTVNSFGALEEPNHVMEELVPYLLNLHYKDFTVGRLDHMMGFQITGCPAGQGMLNANRLKELIKENQKDINVILELWTPFTNTVAETIRRENQWADESIGYLKKWIAGN